jgi:alcohol dehydrogenase class IV
LAAGLGKRAFVISGKRQEHLDGLFKKLTALGIETTIFQVTGEPDTESVIDALVLAREDRSELVIAVGGGSVIDTGKAIAALIQGEGDLFDYLEVVGQGKPLQNPKKPLIAVPTTAGTGAEVTANAVIASRAHNVKVSLRHPQMLPTIALIDPLLTHSQPPSITAGSGLDALTQLIEPFVSISASPFTDSLCREGLARVRTALRAAYHDGSNAQAREDMCLASLLSGIALANAKLGAVHGIAGPLGGMVTAPHGQLCAALLVAVMRTNIRSLQSRKGPENGLRRYREIAEILLDQRGVSAEEGIDWIEQLVKELRIEDLGFWGVSEEMIPDIVEKAMKANSMKGNPVELSLKDIQNIVEKSL